MHCHANSQSYHLLNGPCVRCCSYEQAVALQACDRGQVVWGAARGQLELGTLDAGFELLPDLASGCCFNDRRGRPGICAIGRIAPENADEGCYFLQKLLFGQATARRSRLGLPGIFTVTRSQRVLASSLSIVMKCPSCRAKLELPQPDKLFCTGKMVLKGMPASLPPSSAILCFLACYCH